MSNHIIIGLGGCGSALSNSLQLKLKRNGVDNVQTYLFNTSKTDMKGMNVEKYFILGESEGCGKDRELGKKIAKSEIEEITVFFEELKEKSDISSVHILFSSGGGTGSGFSTIFVMQAKKILGKEYPIFVNMIKPFEFETIPNINSVNNLVEFSNMLTNKQIVFNLIDNNVLSEQFNTTEFNVINDYIIEGLMLRFYHYVENNSKPASSFSLDEKDFYRVVSQKGNTAGLLSIYGYKKGAFSQLYNFAGLENEQFEGARKVLAIVKDSKFIKPVQKTVKSMGNTSVLEFKAMEFSNKIVGNDSYEALIFAIGEPKYDLLTEDLLNKFMESQNAKEEVAKKDEIKENIKSKGVKKVRVKF
jgi:cell division GTPase FtsZ